MKKAVKAFPGRIIAPPRPRPRPMTHVDHLIYEHHCKMYERQRNFQRLRCCSFCVRVLEILVDTQENKPDNDYFICCKECQPSYRRLKKINACLPDRMVDPPLGRKCRYCLLRASLIDDIKNQLVFYHVCGSCEKMLIEQGYFKDSDFVKNKYIYD